MTPLQRCLRPLGHVLIQQRALLEQNWGRCWETLGGQSQPSPEGWLRVIWAFYADLVLLALPYRILLIIQLSSVEDPDFQLYLSSYYQEKKKWLTDPQERGNELRNVTLRQLYRKAPENWEIRKRLIRLGVSEISQIGLRKITCLPLPISLSARKFINLQKVVADIMGRAIIMTQDEPWTRNE